jgi:Uma2 family endonuclease
MTSSPTMVVNSAGQRPPPTPVSFEEFLRWSDEDTLAEWVEGAVVPMSPSNLEHQDLLGFLYELIKTFVRARQFGTVIFAPFVMRLPSRPSGREPDLLFVAPTHAERLRETYLDGPADLVVEIISPESEARDRGEKFVEYEAAGIPEYWLIDPLRRDALFFQIGPDGRFRRAALDPDGFYRSEVLSGFRLQVAWLWERPLPPVAQVVGQLEA